MNWKRGSVLCGLIALVASGGARAELIPEVSQNWPDISLGFGSLYYDHDGGAGGEGLLRLVASNSTLRLSSGGPSVTQLYSSGPDVALSIVVDNETGGFLSGTVDISFGSNGSQPQFAWTGSLTDFGFAADGTTFNATWQVTGDQYRNLPTPSFAALSDGLLAGYTGGIILSNASGWSGTGFSHTTTGAENFGIDWIMGAVNNNLAAYRAGMTNPIVVTTATAADVFVPLPAGVWLLASAFGSLASLTWRRRTVLGGALA